MSLLRKFHFVIIIIFVIFLLLYSILIKKIIVKNIKVILFLKKMTSTDKLSITTLNQRFFIYIIVLINLHIKKIKED
jgi:hypothetical protein